MVLCIVVSRAFQVLSDPDKRSKFDKFGGDPDNRFGSSASAGESPFSGFGRSGGGFGSRGGQMFEEEISPEEMFRQFFGGGMGGFGGGPFGKSNHFRYSNNDKRNWERSQRQRERQDETMHSLLSLIPRPANSGYGVLSFLTTSFPHANLSPQAAASSTPAPASSST